MRLQNHNGNEKNVKEILAGSIARAVFTRSLEEIRESGASQNIAESKSMRGG